MEGKFDVFCIGKTTIDQFLIINQSTIKCHLDPKTNYLSFKHGEKIDVEEFALCVGGNATNVSIGLSRLGLSTGLCSEIGDDEFALKISNTLGMENIDRSYMVKTEGARSSFSVILNFKGERTIFMQRIQREHKFQFADIATKYIFLTSLEKEWQEPYRQALRLVNKGCELVFNPGTLQLRDGHALVAQILKHTNILFVNKEEAEEIVLGHEKRKRNNERKYIRSLLVKLQKMGVKIAVVTNGRYGSHAIDEGGNFYHEGLFSGEIVERTGAGDAYTAGFLAARVYGLSIERAMKWGAVNAASVVGKIGAVEGLLDKVSLEKRVKDGVMSAVVEKGNLITFFGQAFEKLGLKF